MQTEMLLLRVDAYSASEPIESDRWATTDRGWIYDDGHPDRDRAYDGNRPIGNYLDYGPCGEHYRTDPRGAVHACYTPWRIDPVTGGYCRFFGESRHCKTVGEAIAWIKQCRKLDREARHG